MTVWWIASHNAFCCVNFWSQIVSNVISYISMKYNYAYPERSWVDLLKFCIPITNSETNWIYFMIISNIALIFICKKSVPALFIIPTSWTTKSTDWKPIEITVSNQSVWISCTITIASASQTKWKHYSMATWINNICTLGFHFRFYWMCANTIIGITFISLRG